MLNIDALCVSVKQKEILHGISITLEKGTMHVIMGPNGSGKSTLANALMGHPKYTVTNGDVSIDGEIITHVKPHERARKGLFLSMQYTPEICGVTVANFLRQSIESITQQKQNPMVFYQRLQEKMKQLSIDPEFAKRYVNVGFSGGEKKRIEILQLLMLHPKYAILDETDSGLDSDAMKIVAHCINQFRGPETGILLITHYSRMLEYVEPDIVHVMMNGMIVESGGKELIHIIEKDGFTNVIKNSQL